MKIMKTDTAQPTNFKSLFVSDRITSNKNKDLIPNYNAIRNAITQNKLDKKRNVDIILDYDIGEDTFYGVISSKKQGIPENPSNFCKITPQKKDISIFKKWVNAWNKAYSLAELKAWKELSSLLSKI